MFKRRRSTDDEASADDDVLDAPADELEDLDEVDEISAELEDAEDDEDDVDSRGANWGSVDRTNGPYDSTEIDDDVVRIDLGALRLEPIESVEVRLEIDEETGAVSALTLVNGGSALQIGAFAAPRTEGIWDEVRGQIAASITSSGGTVDEREGDYGIALHAKVPAQDEKGRPVTQPVLFVGVDGPRWFLRGLLSGAGTANPAEAEPLWESFRTIVVVRGTDPMAPHEPLPIELPREATEPDGEPEASGHDLNPFRRGPEITEIR